MEIYHHDELLTHLSDIVDVAKQFDLEFCKTPLRKNILTIQGDQSAGKSSFINHLFGNVQIRQTGTQAVDSCFTIIETVPEEEFKELCGHEYRQDEFTKEQLLQPIIRMNTDERKNNVWYELKQTQKMTRYKQFYESNLRTIFTRYNELVKAIVVNERYVKGTEIERIIWKQQKKVEKSTTDEGDYVSISTKQIRRPLVKDLIIIDTPGFNDESLKDAEKFKANIEILEFVFSQSSLVLFMLSSDHMLSIGNSLHMLQLVLLDPATKKSLFDTVQKELTKETNTSSFMQSLIGVAYNLMEVKVKNIINLGQGKRDTEKVKHQYFGSSIYDKLYFVINKIDLCKNPHYAFFELGLSIGRKFQYLPLPMADRVLGIGIPFVQRMNQLDKRNFKLHQLKIGQLVELENILQTLREEHLIQNKILSHIQYIYEKIREVYHNQSYYQQYWTRDAYKKAKKICNLCFIEIKKEDD